MELTSSAPENLKHFWAEKKYVSLHFQGNQGLWDQRAALIWVRENIKQFGGNPNKVTLSGNPYAGFHPLTEADIRDKGRHEPPICIDHKCSKIINSHS